MRLRAATLAILGAVALGAVSRARRDVQRHDDGRQGAGSLRQAVIDANNSTDPSNTITFSSSGGLDDHAGFSAREHHERHADLRRHRDPGLLINGPGTSSF